MRRFIASSIILALGWLIQMPTIHAFGMESDRMDVTHHIASQSMHAWTDGTCTKTEQPKKDCTQSCYEVASVNRATAYVNFIESPEIATQSVIIPTEVVALATTDSRKLHSTAPPEKPNSGRYAALIGIIKRTN